MPASAIKGIAPRSAFIVRVFITKVEQLKHAKNGRRTEGKTATNYQTNVKKIK